MGIELPGWLRWVGDMIGEPFPEGDETACRRQADRWRQLAEQLSGLKGELDTATQTTRSGFGAGEIHEQLDQLLKPYGSSVDEIAGQFRQLGEAVDGVATEIEFAKEMFIANLVLLAAAVTALIATAWINWTAPVEIAAAVAVAEAAISQVIRAAVSKVASEAIARIIAQVVVRALEGAAVNAVMSGALNAGIQSQQILQGNRHEFDSRSLLNDVESGAISGAVLGPLLRGANDFDAGSALANRAKNFGASFVGNAGGTLAAQQAMTGQVNIADAMGAGLVFGGVDGTRSPGVHSGATPDTMSLTADRPGAPPVEPLPPKPHSQTPPVEPSVTSAGHSPDGVAAPGNVDVPFNLGPRGPEATLAPTSVNGQDTTAGLHTAPTAGPHPGVTDTPTTGSAAGAAPPTNHVPVSAPAGSAPTTGHASPSAGSPQIPAARAGVADAAAGPHSWRDAAAPLRASSISHDHQLPRDTTQPRDVPPTRDAPATRDAPPPRDTPPARDLQHPETQPPRDGQQRRDATPARYGQPAPDRSRPPGQESRLSGESRADPARRAESTSDLANDVVGKLDSEHQPETSTRHDADATPSVVVSPVVPDAGLSRSAVVDATPRLDRFGGRHDPRDGPAPRRLDSDDPHDGGDPHDADDPPPSGPGPIDPTGFDNPANHRSYGSDELAPLEDPIHQTRLEDALRGPDGNYLLGADPRTNAYGDLVNDGGPTVDGRANNCLDNSLAALASFYGEPTVAVPRFLDQLPDGTIDMTSGEANGLDRAEAWLGDHLHLADQSLSVREQFAALHQQISQLGPGSSALVVNDWHARDGAGDLMFNQDGTPVLEGSHATVVVYPRDASGPVWWDPQHGLTSDHPPAMLVDDSAYLWSTPIAADHFGPNPQQGGQHGAAGNHGTSAGLPGADLPRPHLPGDPVRDGVGRVGDPPPGGEQHRQVDRSVEAGDRLGNRDRDHTFQPADQRGGTDLHGGQEVRPADGKSDLPAPVADQPPAHQGGPRDHRLPDHGGLPERATGAHPGPPADHQQADLHPRADGRALESRDVAGRVDQPAEPGSVARGDDRTALGERGPKWKLFSEGPNGPAVLRATDPALAGHEVQVPRTSHTVDLPGDLREITRTVGRNEAEFFQTGGTTTRVHLVLRETFDGIRPIHADEAIRSALRGDGLVGGRIADFRFMLDQGEPNMYRQDPHFNSSAYRTLENEWATWVREGARVEVVVDLDPQTGRITVGYEVFDDRHGNQIYYKRADFANSAQDTFERVTTRDIRERLTASQRIAEGTLHPTTDPARSSEKLGDGWFKIQDRHNIDPNYGDPLPAHWRHPDDPLDPAHITADLQDLRRDKAAPYGRDPDGNPYTQAQYEERFDLLTADGKQYVNFPGNDGAVPGTKTLYTSLERFVEHYGPMLDRIGNDSGKYLGLMERGEPAIWEQRAMHVGSLREPFSIFALEELPAGWKIEVSQIAPGCGHPGGGIQVRIIDAAGQVQPVKELVKLEILDDGGDFD